MGSTGGVGVTTPSLMRATCAVHAQQDGAAPRGEQQQSAGQPASPRLDQGQREQPPDDFQSPGNPRESDDEGVVGERAPFDAATEATHSRGAA